ncbi:MAG: methionine biosynthesis protein MetW, partial [Candidatus Aenigmatarchaeota archaeon]
EEVTKLREVVLGLEKSTEDFRRFSNEINTRLSGIEEKVSQNAEKREILELNEKIKLISEEVTKLREVVLGLEKSTEDFRRFSNEINTRLSGIEEKVSQGDKFMLEEYYYLFEEKFRGTRELIKNRMRRYLPYFKGCTRVLDIGCGRGEFLELCKEENIPAIGIDLNEDMIKFCEGKFNVLKINAIDYLKQLEDKSLDGIMISHVLEHLNPEEVLELLLLCYKKMKYSSYLVIEVPNVTSVYTLINFYIDLSHKIPLHPETIKFLLEYLGFRETKIEFFEEINEDVKLTRINEETFPDEFVKIFNQNVEKINRIIFGPQNCAVIAKK